jgi:hypothetical protein
MSQTLHISYLSCNCKVSNLYCTAGIPIFDSSIINKENIYKSQLLLGDYCVVAKEIDI